MDIIKIENEKLEKKVIGVCEQYSKILREADTDLYEKYAKDTLKKLRPAFKTLKESALKWEKCWIKEHALHKESTKKAKIEYITKINKSLATIIAYAAQVHLHIKKHFPKLQYIALYRNILKEIKSDLTELQEYFNISCFDIASILIQERLEMKK